MWYRYVTCDIDVWRCAACDERHGSCDVRCVICDVTCHARDIVQNSHTCDTAMRRYVKCVIDGDMSFVLRETHISHLNPKP